MENTNVIIPTANVEGNIGSCKTELTSIYNGRNLFVEYKTNIATNSCNGDIHTYNTWELSEISLIGFSVIIFLGVIVFLNKYIW